MIKREINEAKPNLLQRGNKTIKNHIPQDKREIWETKSNRKTGFLASYPINDNKLSDIESLL
jgi:hypothetical protein